MKAKLIPIVEGEVQRAIPLSPSDPLVVGRGEAADIPLLQSKVSRLHCRISFENGFYVIEDLESTNGTWVNNRRVQRAILFHHDRIAIGNAEFQFALEGDISDETSWVELGETTDTLFGTEIKQPAEHLAPSSLFLEIPEGEAPPQTEELERDLAAICRVINSVNAEPHLDKLLETVMDNVMEVTDADRGYLIAAKKVGGPLMPLVARNKDTVPPSARNSFSRSIISECYEGGYSILMSDPASREDVSESIFSQEIQSIMCVPTCDSEGPVGVLYVDRILGSEQFSERDLKVLTAIANQAGTAIRRAQLSRQVESLFGDAIRTVINLVEATDEYTYSHSERVTAVALLIADLCPIEKAQKQGLEIGGLLHDVGKLAVEPKILYKPGALDKSEYEQVKQHPAAGAAIFKNIENAEVITDVVRHHHERWDGDGYPDGLAAEDISLPARVMALADSFDSMASDRPYKKALPHSEIIDELQRGKATQFDPDLVERFVDALEDDKIFQSRIEELYRRKEQKVEATGKT